MLLITHSLEKGMASKKPRKFGIDKTKELMRLIEKYIAYGDYSNKYAFVCAINILRSYVKFYEQHEWNDEDEYIKTVDFLNMYKDVRDINIGSYTLNKKDFIQDSSIDYEKFLASRHSVRTYLNKELSKDDIRKATKIALLSPSACNRQMCKTYYVQNKTKARKIISMAQGFGGFEIDTINLLIVTFDVNANYMIGERNQGWFNAGLFSMNLVNALHSIGIGSCFCQFGNSTKDEEVIKTLLGIPNNERIAVLIAAGYYCEKMKIPYSPRKNLEDILVLK